MRPILSAIGLSAGSRPATLDFRGGPGPRTLDLPGFGRAGVQICYEIIFSGQVVDRANRPDFIFNPSNDAWFGAWGPPQHLAQARLRAIEEGLPVIRATPTGISAVIDADGRLLAQPAARRAPARSTPACRAAAPPTLVRPLRQPALLRLRAAARRGGDCSAAQNALAARAHKDIFISAIPSDEGPSADDAQQLSLHVRIGFRRPSRQGRRPDFSDAVVDLFIGRDPEARVACETMVTTNRIVLAGEVSAAARTSTPTPGRDRAGGARDGEEDRLRAARLPLAICRFRLPPARPVRPYRAWASTRAATRTRAPATRASCSATPPTRRPT